jgi:guanylate kinase
VESVQALGKICILDIDVQGVQKVKENARLQPHFLFITPPSMEDLEQRRRGRGTENEEQAKLRLSNAALELEYFDRILVNNDLRQFFEQLVSLLKTWNPHLVELSK